ncbi:Uncharacterized protein OS=Isosphaera pallida (strain ATCC 43644 / DSM 9630 / IS1B) GN=Isop_2427 PE=4 SV=1 [Gemmata massiliana]|uniref:Uncharacterized protein n=1 Tax=Gemmata massiliana TaxID=1210884 RepID=A0A6P2CUI7_9BACT|nr:hypothetical protein [Gemmata massiliana]VTR92818.1 Uncharacterized protein OS=Isosphaera pallida (strain ATCC 43644 / DSM 9630 / IS1B) GN=Isop_2427 PE=4 SV=1 [Gemmata massiliana]
MNRFKDLEGREWGVALHVRAVERVEERTGVEIGALLRDKFAGLFELFGSPARFVRVLWVLVEGQAEKLKVTPEQFGESLGGDALEAAYTAFVGALSDFFPSRLRTAIRALTVAPFLVADRSTCSACATNSPESSASIPPG